MSAAPEFFEQVGERAVDLARLHRLPLGQSTVEDQAHDQTFDATIRERERVAAHAVLAPLPFLGLAGAIISTAFVGRGEHAQGLARPRRACTIHCVAGLRVVP